MMKSGFLVISALFVSGWIVSCDPAYGRAEELARIDSCLAALDDLQATYDGIEFDSLAMMVEHVNYNEEMIKKHYRPDTLDELFGRYVTECKGVRKAMSGAKNKKAHFNEELNALKKQFADLKTDILNGLFSDDELRNNLNRELEDLKILNKSLTDFDSLQKIHSRIYYNDVPNVDLVITEMIAKNDSIVE